MPKKLPPPPIAQETLRALVAAATEYAAAKPWEDMLDSQVVGLTDPVTHEVRLACVLGRAGEVFGAAIYRNITGIHWLLTIMENPETELSLEEAMAMDSLKVEFVLKRELGKEDLNGLKEIGFKPSGKGRGWPQFRSAQPGWMPWHIDQTEAGQLLADLPRLTRFCAWLRQHPDSYNHHQELEIPFLPSVMPDRDLTEEDLAWQVLKNPPLAVEPYQCGPAQLDQLRKLKSNAKLVCEYCCEIISGGAFLEQGRPCLSRVSLLVEPVRGLVLGHKLFPSALPFMTCAGSGLVEILIERGFVPGILRIDQPRLAAALQPLCDELHIRLELAKLPSLAAAKASLERFLRFGQG